MATFHKHQLTWWILVARSCTELPRLPSQTPAPTSSCRAPDLSGRSEQLPASVRRAEGEPSWAKKVQTDRDFLTSYWYLVLLSTVHPTPEVFSFWALNWVGTSLTIYYSPLVRTDQARKSIKYSPQIVVVSFAIMKIYYLIYYLIYIV